MRHIFPNLVSLPYKISQTLNTNVKDFIKRTFRIGSGRESLLYTWTMDPCLIGGITGRGLRTCFCWFCFLMASQAILRAVCPSIWFSRNSVIFFKATFISSCRSTTLSVLDRDSFSILPSSDWLYRPLYLKYSNIAPCILFCKDCN